MSKKCGKIQKEIHKCGKFQIEFPNVKKCGEIPWILRLIFDADNLLRCSVMWHQNELSIYGEFVPEKISIFKLGHSPLLHLTAWRTHTYLSLVFSAMLWACSHICQEGWNLCAKWDNMTCLCYLHHNITSPLAFLRGKTDRFLLFKNNKMILRKPFSFAPIPMWSTDLLAFWTVLKRLNTKVDDLDLENFPFFQVAAIDVKKKKQKLVKVGNFSLYYHSFKSSSFEGFDECAWAIFKKYLKGKEKIFLLNNQTLKIKQVCS